MARNWFKALRDGIYGLNWDETDSSLKRPCHKSIFINVFSINLNKQQELRRGFYDMTFVYAAWNWLEKIILWDHIDIQGRRHWDNSRSKREWRFVFFALRLCLLYLLLISLDHWSRLFLYGYWPWQRFSSCFAIIQASRKDIRWHSRRKTTLTHAWIIITFQILITSFAEFLRSRMQKLHLFSLWASAGKKVTAASRNIKPLSLSYRTCLFSIWKTRIIDHRKMKLECATQKGIMQRRS